MLELVPAYWGDVLKQPWVALRLALAFANGLRGGPLILRYLELTAYEHVVTRLLHQIARPGMVAADLGAHIGYYTTLLSRIVGPTGTVYAVEPEPRNLVMLNENITRLRNVRVIAGAVSDRSGEAVLLRMNTLGDHSLTSTLERPRDQILVRTLTLDSVVEGRLDLVKIDIQGEEHRALLGMQRLLAENPMLQLIVEWWPRGLELGGTRPVELLTNLRSLGFAIYEITEGGLQPADDDELIGSMRTRMLYAVRPE